MLFTNIMMYAMAVFAGIGMIDKIIFHNRFGYGKEFDSGLSTLGPIVTSMAGFLCAAPVLQTWLMPISSCFSRITGAEPSMLTGTFLAIDMGGLPLALQSTSDLHMAAFTGGLYASMMGACISFMMPVALELLNPSEYSCLAKGMLYGICIIPISCLAGGLFIGLSIPTLLRNLFPVFLLSLLLGIGLWKIPGRLLPAFQTFSKVILALAHLFLFFATFQELTGLPLISGMETLHSQFPVIGTIAITLAGAYPFMKFLTTVFQKGLSCLAKKFQISNTCIESMLICTCNCIPMLEKLDKLPSKEKIIAIAFMVPAAFTFGDHLAYLSAVLPEYLPAILAAKFFGGAAAAVFAAYMESRQTHSR